jgi:hypothetical protein
MFALEFHAKIYDMIRYMMYDMIYYMIYLLTAIGYITHLYLHTNNTCNNTNNNRTTQITTNLEECGPCHVFANFTLAFALQLRKSMEKPQSG